MNVSLTPNKQALDAVKDAKTIRALRSTAVEHRRKLLQLGHDLKIRLHYGAAMSCVEILTLLYGRWLNLNPVNPDWSDRDRFVLSKGHAAPALYAALWLRGFFPKETFDTFRRLGSPLQGHPDRNKTPGVDCSTGSLGQGFPVACGMALGAQIDRASYRVYCLISDGECNEGSTWEAALIAANLKLEKLTVFLDWNMKSSYGLMAGRNDIQPLKEKWLAFGWRVFECEGHDYPDLSRALSEAENVEGQPSVLICRTVKGKGIPYAEHYPTRSNFALTEEQYLEALHALADEERKNV